ncbi:hypothetical protein FE257_001197 [Aspergillus nanangensis]|uniref:Tyrosine specific protein phosphatases domain-containing protein n=1 Tax=Aspergillus nanangensis TaxID=2582783 RepID=A0AAD4CE89_ASPNN|nr:hypothetical protein FE257_001197 [Aspergillus nanangensis]
MANPKPTQSPLPPPFINVQGISNFRDIGGYDAGPNRTIRSRYIFRCAEPTNATDLGIATIKSLGVNHIFDLRSRPEIEKLQISSPSGQVVDWPGVQRVYCPVFPDESFDPVSLATRYADYSNPNSEGIVRAYRAIMRQGADAYAQIMRHILYSPPAEGSFIFHCTAGKDRTGVFCALLLSLCGVDDETVAREYALTEIGLAGWLDTLVGSIMSQTGASEQDARRMAGASRENMLATLKMVREQYGDAAGYFIRECGLTEADLVCVRERLIVEKLKL